MSEWTVLSDYGLANDTPLSKLLEGASHLYIDGGKQLVYVDYWNSPERA